MSAFSFPSCQILSAISSPPALPLGFVGFSPLMFFSVTGACSFPLVWGLMAGLAVVPVMGALFQSGGWLPIVEVPGYSRHRTSILAMQLLIKYKKVYSRQYVFNHTSVSYWLTPSKKALRVRCVFFIYLASKLNRKGPYAGRHKCQHIVILQSSIHP